MLFPRIRANPRDAVLQERMLDRTSALSLQDHGSIYQMPNRGLSKNVSRDTISLTSQDIKNYQMPHRGRNQLIRDRSVRYMPDSGAKHVYGGVLPVDHLRGYAQSTIQTTESLGSSMDPGRQEQRSSPPGAAEATARRASMNRYGDAEAVVQQSTANNAPQSGPRPDEDGQARAADNGASIGEQAHNSLHISESMMKKVEIEKNSELNDDKSKSVLLSNQKRANNHQQMQAYETSDPHTLPRIRTNADSLSAKPMRDRREGSQRSLSLQRSAANPHLSQLSHAGSVSLLQLRTHNQGVMDKARAHEFTSPDIAQEVLNKPLQKKAYLAAAHSMRPYANPNKAYYFNRKHGQLQRHEHENLNLAQQIQSAGLLSGLPAPARPQELGRSKLIPTFKTKQYVKMKALLPAVQSTSVLPLGGERSASALEPMQNSLIFKQMKSMQAASEFEQQRLAEVEHQKQLLQEEIQRGEQKKGDAKQRKQSQLNVKMIEKKLQELRAQPNPHLDVAKRALDLQIHDFSLEDKKRAEKLLEIQKFKAKSSHEAKSAMSQVEIYQGKRAIPTEEQGAENIHVDVPVFEDAADDDAQQAAQSKVSIAGISPQRGTKKLSLNQCIQSEQLNQVIMNEKLIQNLLVQSTRPRNRHEPQTHQAVARAETPNPWYHHQKRKLVLRYQKHLLEQEYARQEHLARQETTRKAAAEKKAKLAKVETQAATRGAGPGQGDLDGRRAQGQATGQQ